MKALFRQLYLLANDLIDFFFPDLCAGCDGHLVKGEEGLCIGCLLTLPVTSFEKYPDNPVMKQFWGKVPVRAAMAYCHFSKGGKMQRMIHELKYNNRPDIGVVLGQQCARKLLASGSSWDAQLVIPVPLHPAKQRARGYNQAAAFGRGLAQVLQVPLLENGLQRNKFTDSQTRKSRFERANNVNRVFNAGDTALLEGRRILLVDDVITTGATLVASAEALLEIPGVSVSIVTIAFARL